jgi:hypothetical protein
MTWLKHYSAKLCILKVNTARSKFTNRGFSWLSAILFNYNYKIKMINKVNKVHRNQNLIQMSIRAIYNPFASDMEKA